MLCLVGESAEGISAWQASPESLGAQSGHNCLRRIQEYLTEAWQANRRLLRTGKRSRADVSAVPISKARWELSCLCGCQQGEAADNWQLQGTRTRQTMPAWTDENQGPGRPLHVQMFCPSPAKSPGSRWEGRRKNPEWTELTWNDLFPVLPSSRMGPQDKLESVMKYRFSHFCTPEFYGQKYYNHYKR